MDLDEEAARLVAAAAYMTRFMERLFPVLDQTRDELDAFDDEEARRLAILIADVWTKAAVHFRAIAEGQI